MSCNLGHSRCGKDEAEARRWYLIIVTAIAPMALFAGAAAAQGPDDSPEVFRVWLTALGPTLAFLTAIAAAFFNAHLNRRRDDRLRNEEARTLALALRAEVQVAAEILERRARMLSRYFEEKDPLRDWPVQVPILAA